MKTTFLLVPIMLLSASLAKPAAAQSPAVTHNTWSSGAAIPTPVYGPAGTAVLKNEIYVVGGGNAAGSIIAETQIYNPATSTWTTGTPLPVATWDGVAAVVKNILYVIGGATSPTAVTNAVWAFNPKTKTWTTKSPMPLARASIGVAVENNIIYVIGGTDGVNRFNNVEAYNPATDTWTEEAPLFIGRSEPSVGLVGKTIVTADGYTTSQWTGDTEGYDAATNAWTELNPDPTARNGACAGGIGPKLYVAGGYDTFGPALSLTEAFKVPKNEWITPLAAMPQNAEFGGAAVYKGQLYCISGWAQFQGTVLNNVQIYQP